MRPAGAVGLVAPSGLIGRIISKRQGVPYSHAIISIGENSKGEVEVFDSTWPWARIKPLSYWDARVVTWWNPRVEFSKEDTRSLRSSAKSMEGRVGYGAWDLLMFLIKGVPNNKQTHHLFCTFAVAWLYIEIRNLDLSGCEQPFNIDVRELLAALQNGPFTRMLA